MTKRSLFLATIVVVLSGLAIATRFLPHPANLTAVGAVGLFAGALFPKKWGMFLPVAIMAATDIFLGFHNTILFTWGSMAFAGFIGYTARTSLSFTSVALGSLFSSVQFFLITNWAVWMFTPLYTKSIDGLFSSYVAGLPFFRNMVVGDFLYTGVLFGVYAVALAAAKRLRVVPNYHLN